MGMYDYLGEYQVKIFYNPIFYKSFMELNNGCSLSHSGGCLKSFGKSEKLPLQTLYYKYPKDFCILDDATYGDYDDTPKDVVHIIKDGEYYNSVDLGDFDNEDIGDKVFTYYGLILNIYNKDDMYNHIKIKKELKNKTNKIEKKYFKNGVMNCIMNDMSYYDSVKDKYHDELGHIKNIYQNKLYEYNDYNNEQILGEYLEVSMIALNGKDNELYKEIKEEFKKFLIRNDNQLIDKYFNWLGNYLAKEDKDYLQNFIKKEIRGL